MKDIYHTFIVGVGVGVHAHMLCFCIHASVECVSK